MGLKIDNFKLAALLFLIPSFSFAATISGSGGIASLANKILDLILLFPRLIIGLALAYFFYGLSGYVYALDEKKKAAARDTMFYGVIGLFVMMSVWGIVYTVANLLGIY